MFEILHRPGHLTVLFSSLLWPNVEYLFPSFFPILSLTLNLVPRSSDSDRFVFWANTFLPAAYRKNGHRQAMFKHILSYGVFVKGLHYLQQLNLQQSVCLRRDSVQISSCSLILQFLCFDLSTQSVKGPDDSNVHIAKITKHNITVKYSE